MTFDINENLIKVKSDAIPIGRTMELGEDVRLLLEGTVVQLQEVDNNDGTKNVIYLVKGIIAQYEVPTDSDD